MARLKKSGAFTYSPTEVRLLAMDFDGYCSRMIGRNHVT